MNDLIPDGYRVLRAEDIGPLLAREPAIAALLGGEATDWRVRDVADGNINAVYLVEGPAGGVCAKQALPWLRVAGESWPLPLERAVADYVAAAGFFTSDLASPFERKCEDLALFSRNVALQRISVDLVFTDPYAVAPRNHWLEPWLDAWAAALRNDLALKTAVARHRLNYLTHTQALIHGDLHSGSVMVTETDTRVIDGEFAWLGPIGFDLGAFIANLVMAWFAKPVDAGRAAEQAGYRQWILDQTVLFWQRFDLQFRAHWSGHAAANDAYPANHFDTVAGQARLAAIQRDYVGRIFDDTLAYAAIKIIRRIVGFAQVADFVAIEDPQRRAQAQAGALALARDLLLRPQRFPDIAALVDAVPCYEGAGLDPDLARRL
jgi:5-methylthioribose kinase